MFTCVHVYACMCVRVRTDLENLEKYLNFEMRFQGLEKALKIGEIKKILEKTLNYGVTSLTFVESKILVSRIEAVCRKALAKSWDRSTSGVGAGIDAKADGMRGRVGVDPRLRTSIARRLNLQHGLACVGYRRLRNDDQNDKKGIE